MINALIQLDRKTPLALSVYFLYAVLQGHCFQSLTSRRKFAVSGLLNVSQAFLMRVGFSFNLSSELPVTETHSSVMKTWRE